MIKKITTNNHVFLVEETPTKYNKDAIYGRSLLLSIYIGINIKSGTKTGQYYFSDTPVRIAGKSSVLSITEPTKKEIEFYNLVKKCKTINYSKKLVTRYNIKHYLRSYFVVPKEERNDNPKCVLYFDSSIL